MRDGANMSSWGGGAVQVNGTWHLWASLLSHHCGISAYLTNSEVVHATSKDLLGPYVEDEVVLPPFAHEPVVTLAPTGELVMATVTGPVGDTPAATHGSCVCSSGATAKNCSCIGNNSCVAQVPTLSVATSADGPWHTAPMARPIRVDRPQRRAVGRQPRR
jgi:hypothetical protein